MIWNNIISFYITFLLLPIPSVAGSYHPILDHIKPNTITIIGETHKHKESIHLFHALIKDSLLQNQCLIVGLEIASNQQPIIDKIAQGRATAADIEIAPMIDHPPFRKLIDNLVKLQRNGTCLKLVAIDAGNDVDMGRDEWMSIKLAEQAGQRPVLALLGSLHTLKKINWDLSMADPSPKAAEILDSQGYGVTTYPQIWTDKSCPSKNRFISADQSEALQLINNDLISLLNAFEFKSLTNVINGVILWECTTSPDVNTSQNPG